MMNPADFADCFIETFDKSARSVFQRWLARLPAATKWIIAADFSLHDAKRPQDCFAFSIIPYDRYPHEFAEEVSQKLPRDLKNSKTLEDAGVAWLRDPRHFHILIPMHQDRMYYSDISGSKAKAIEVARQSLVGDLAGMVRLERHKEQIDRFRSAVTRSRANSFKLRLFSDLTLLSLYLAIASLLLCRERKPAMISWFCDRDKMTNYLDGIVWDYATENFRGLAQRAGIDIADVEPVIGVPDRSSGTEVMWFDQYIRAPDWLAGAIAAWDRSTNRLAGESTKYVRLIDEVIADSDNTVILPVYLDGEGVKVTRLEVNAGAPSGP